MMTIAGSSVLVTGANRGVGRAFCRELLDRGAARVYAGARDPELVDVEGAIPVRLDITNPGQVADAASALSDVNLLVNNAGILRATPL